MCPLPTDSPAPVPCAHDHEVAFYSSEAFLVATVRDFLVPALQAGESAIVIATPEHREAFEAALAGSGIDVAAASRTGAWTSLDAAETLQRFMVGGLPDAAAFRATVEPLLDRAAAGGRPVRAYGEMVALLWADGEAAAAVALEDAWNELGALRPFELLCAYPIGGFRGAGAAAAFARICDRHDVVTPADGFPSFGDVMTDEDCRTVALLQQQLVSLRSDVARISSAHAELSELVFVDALTGLGNRRAFDLELERAWCTGDETTWVLTADLDGFKAINDRRGHAAGDEVLRRVAAALRLVVRRTDVVARVGGDEFAGLLVGYDADAVLAFERRLHGAVAAIDVGSGTPLGVSIGHALLTAAGSGGAALDRADRAMLAAKRTDRSPLRLVPRSR